jgi:hypothetical protein
MACPSGIRARLSWVLAAEVAIASGSPAASVSTCSLEPGLPRSTGFGPVSGPFSLGHSPRRPPRGTSRSPPARRADRALPDAAAVTAPPRSRPRTRGARSPWTRRTPPAGAARRSRWSAVDDRGEHRPVIDAAGTPALRTLRLRRDQRLDDLPQPVGHQFLAQSFLCVRTTPRMSPLIHVRQALSNNSPQKAKGGRRTQRDYDVFTQSRPGLPPGPSGDVAGVSPRAGPTSRPLSAPRGIHHLNRRFDHRRPVRDAAGPYPGPAPIDRHVRQGSPRATSRTPSKIFWTTAPGWYLAVIRCSSAATARRRSGCSRK